MVTPVYKIGSRIIMMSKGKTTNNSMIWIVSFF